MESDHVRQWSFYSIQGSNDTSFVSNKHCNEAYNDGGSSFVGTLAYRCAHDVTARYIRVYSNSPSYDISVCEVNVLSDPGKNKAFGTSVWQNVTTRWDYKLLTNGKIADFYSNIIGLNDALRIRIELAEITQVNRVIVAMQHGFNRN